MNPVENIGTLLSVRRRALGMTQRELGERVGAKQPQIARWETTAYRTASLERVAAVARALNSELAVVSWGGLPLAAEDVATYAPAQPEAAPEGVAALSRLRVDPGVIAAFCRMHGIREFALFGSVLRPDFGPHSDVDVLVTFAEGHRMDDPGSWTDLSRELEGIFRRRVDVVDRRAVEGSENYIRRTHILREARVVYVAG